MQTRSRFLKSVAGVALFGWLGGRLPESPAAVVEEGIIRDSVLVPTNDFQVFADGGLCAPLKPFYEMPVFENGWRNALMKDAIPTFKAERGGVTVFPK